MKSQEEIFREYAKQQEEEFNKNHPMEFVLCAGYCGDLVVKNRTIITKYGFFCDKCYNPHTIFGFYV